MGASYDGRAAVPSISREGVTQKSCRVTATQSIIKVTEQSVCFGRGGVTAFTERRVTGVLLPFAHAMAGCDTTSRLFGIGKGVDLRKLNVEHCADFQANSLKAHLH